MHHRKIAKCAHYSERARADEAATKTGEPSPKRRETAADTRAIFPQEDGGNRTETESAPHPQRESTPDKAMRDCGTSATGTDDESLAGKPERRLTLQPKERTRDRRKSGVDADSRSGMRGGNRN